MQEFLLNSVVTRIPRLMLSLAFVALGVSTVATAAAPVDIPADLPHDLNKPPAEVKPKSGKKKWFEIGKASWYGSAFQGRTTANGEMYDMNSLTCAHRSLPLGSWARVTNLRTKKSIFVRVNDRGPALEDRIVDLSYAAARKLGIAGLAKVRIDPVNANNMSEVRQLVAQTSLVQPVMVASR